jgi:hypothetical protein
LKLVQERARNIMEAIVIGNDLLNGTQNVFTYEREKVKEGEYG